MMEMHELDGALEVHPGMWLLWRVLGLWLNPLKVQDKVFSSLWYDLGHQSA